MLQLDSLVIDLIFHKRAELDPETLTEALGGQEELARHKILDPDMQDPRFEMEISPSMPFRRRGERRLLIIDDSHAPMRADPRGDPVVPIDLGPSRDRLIGLCETLDVRLGRLFALGSWGDAVLVARSAADLRGIALISWALDPSIDVDGKRRASRLGPPEIEAKLAAYGKRLDERSENEILGDLADARLERRGELLVVDVLEEDGTWDLRRSLALEKSLAAVDKFSLIPGAPSAGGSGSQEDAKGDTKNGAKGGTKAEQPNAAPDKAAPASKAPPAPLGVAELDGRVVLIFPAERFDLDVAAQLGKRDYGVILDRSDPISGEMRDSIYRDGADFIAPLEFLSEVFIDGKPLSRPDLDKNATTHDDGVRTIDAHCPRFGPVLFLDIPKRGRFICSAKTAPGRIVALLP